ncbi:MAG TPA: hypothetical protein H9717_16180 [Candidatus Eisenbergiella merdipullorum]|uniref:Uncharacterized protein n=1 Tax=Candidatus Eisenbergiella merdipullorum TaxID=2838553 RepID=A0A9D2IAL8_9FIRM|nr:hypothetical protein [Candidatus Eisenbergiella merdipullorum]
MKKQKQSGKKSTGSWEKRMEKKIDHLCLVVSGVIIAAAALLELRDRRRQMGE